MKAAGGRGIDVFYGLRVHVFWGLWGQKSTLDPLQTLQSHEAQMASRLRTLNWLQFKLTLIVTHLVWLHQ